MGVNALEIEELIVEAETWIQTHMNDTALSAKSLRDDAEVPRAAAPLSHTLPFRRRLC